MSSFEKQENRDIDSFFVQYTYRKYGTKMFSGWPRTSRTN